MTSCALSTFILVLQAERTRCTQGKQLLSLSQSFLKKVSHQFQDVARWSLSVISDLLLIHACLQSSHEMPSYKKHVQQANTLFVSVTTASINGALVCYLAPTSRYVCLLDTHTKSTNAKLFQSTDIYVWLQKHQHSSGKMGSSETNILCTENHLHSRDQMHSTVLQ